VELLLIRHALPVRLVTEDGSAADPGLEPLGERQARHLRDWLGLEPLDAIYSSPLRRARQTAEPLATACGHDVVIEPDIAEWDRDLSAYITMEELKATNHDTWRAMAEGRLSDVGIDIDAFWARVTSAIDGIAGRHPGGRVAVVCHGGVINAYTAAVLGLVEPLFFEPGYTSISRVLVSRAGTRSVRTLNETAHLRGLDA
jgi:2,3-bisphosphoglycerate-dependent phosphoglycerate mutase